MAARINIIVISKLAATDPEGANRLFSRFEKRYFVSEMV
jgi:hypothetical protein